MINTLQFLVDSNTVNISEMARQLKVSRSSIYRVMDGGVPSAELMLKISAYFKKDATEIFSIQNVQKVVQKKNKKSA